MAKIKKDVVLDEMLISIFDTLTPQLHNIEFIESIPFGKIVTFVYEKVRTISNPEKAFKAIFSYLIPITIYYGLKKYDVRLNEVVKLHEKSFLKLFNSKNLSIHNFNFNNFNNNKIVKLGLDYYLKLLKHNVIDDKKISLIERYYFDYAEVFFYKLLESKKTEYKHLLEFIESKSEKLDFSAKKIEEYRRNLKNLYNDYVWNSNTDYENEKIRLSQIYVEPSFKIYIGSIDVNDTSYNYTATPYLNINEEKYNYSIHTLIDKFLNNSTSLVSHSINNDVSTIIVVGEPGQGKTSFCKRLLYDISEEGTSNYKGDAILIRLREIDDYVKLFQYPFQLFKDIINRKLESSIDFDKSSNLLFILEGLDELIINHNISSKSAADFCHKIITSAKFEKHKVIITTRDRYLSFQNIKSLRNALVVKLKEFDINKQIQWFNKYIVFRNPKNLTLSKIHEINDRREYEDLKQLLQQPILLSIIYELDSPLDNFKNRIDIYKVLFQTVIERKHDPISSAPLKIQEEYLLQEKKEKLLNVMREIAFESYMNERGVIDQDELIDICRGIEYPTEDIEESLKNVLINFYFNEVGSTKDNSSKTILKPERYSIEFFHNTFKEYLGADYIWNRIREELTSNKLRSFIDDSGALSFFNSLFGRKRLNTELINYLEEIIKVEDVFPKDSISKNISKIFPKLLKKDFYIGSQDWDIDRSKNIFLGVWIIYSNVRINVGNNKTPHHLLEDRDLLEKFIYFLKIGKYSKLNLSNYYFDQTDFSQTHLDGFNLSYSSFTDTYFKGASLRGCNFKNADLSNADLRCTDLTGCNFKNADLSNADLRGAILFEVDFSRVPSINNAKFGNLMSNEQKTYIKNHGGLIDN